MREESKRGKKHLNKKASKAAVVSKTSEHSGPGSPSVAHSVLQLLRSIGARAPEKHQDAARSPAPAL